MLAFVLSQRGEGGAHRTKLAGFGEISTISYNKRVPRSFALYPVVEKKATVSVAFVLRGGGGGCCLITRVLCDRMVDFLCRVIVQGVLSVRAPKNKIQRRYISHQHQGMKISDVC